ncbi:hypothetical protein HDE_12793 [Halotydeus destructor]|nr:hypothetical protein HDE_12793 [Halotydeus destructor]
MKEDDEKDDEEVDSASQPQSTTESATQEKAKLLVVIRLIGQLYLEANRYCITKEFVLNVVRKLVADFSTVRPCDAQLPLEGLWTLMNIIGGKLREDYKGLAKSLQYMTPFLRLEQFIKGREVSEEGQQMFKDIMGQASY